MTAYAKRLYLLRERLDKSEVEVARSVGLSVAAYFDLEYRDAELLTGPSVRQVVRLAQVLGVSPLRLLASEFFQGGEVARVSFAQLAAEIGDYLPRHALSLADFETQIGRKLGDFLHNPDVLWDKPVIFIHDVCQPLGIHWLQLIPPADTIKDNLRIIS